MRITTSFSASLLTIESFWLFFFFFSKIIILGDRNEELLTDTFTLAARWLIVAELTKSLFSYFLFIFFFYLFSWLQARRRDVYFSIQTRLITVPILVAGPSALGRPRLSSARLGRTPALYLRGRLIYHRRRSPEVLVFQAQGQHQAELRPTPASSIHPHYNLLLTPSRDKTQRLLATSCLVGFCWITEGRIWDEVATARLRKNILLTVEESWCLDYFKGYKKAWNF